MTSNIHFASPLADNHCHTKDFSFDGQMSAGEMIDVSIKKGLDSVVVTDHYEEDYPIRSSKPQVFDLNEYFEKLAVWQEMAGNRIQIRKGIELGYQPHLVQVYTELISSYDFDSVISSMHLLKNKDPYYCKECYDPIKETVYEEYILQLCEMVKSFRAFDILGHYDYISRYATYDDKLMTYACAPDAFDKLFLLLIKNHISLEFNTSTMKKLCSQGARATLPDPRVYTRYRELGGEMVTLGSDAHNADSLGDYFAEAISFLKDCGFSGQTLFKKRKAEIIPF